MGEDRRREVELTCYSSTTSVRSTEAPGTPTPPGASNPDPMNPSLPAASPAHGAPPPPVPSTPTPARAVLCDASDWGLLAVDGADAQAFLQGQLSSDVKGLAAGAAQWTSYSSAKGRMLANGLLWRNPVGDGFRLALAADIVLTTTKRLTMFVLRSRVAIGSLGATHAWFGIGGSGAREAADAALFACPPLGHAAVRDGVEIVAFPDGRVLVVVPNDRAGGIRAQLAAATVPGDAQAWRRFAILAGTALVRASTQDQLLPQAINLDVLGGVVLNRDKGCFPGQEIIKRTQALGQLKERLHAFATTSPAAAAGTKVFGATFGDQACGIVVDAADAPDGGSVLLATVQIRAAEADVLHVGAPDGAELSPLALPYAMPAPAPRGPAGASAA
jgi:folate-binding protein YgfZ